MMDARIKTGARFSYRGDRANLPGTGTITNVEPCEWNGSRITVTFDEDSRMADAETPRETEVLSPSSFSAGNAGGPRFEILEGERN